MNMHIGRRWQLQPIELLKFHDSVDTNREFLGKLEVSTLTTGMNRSRGHQNIVK